MPKILLVEVNELTRDMPTRRLTGAAPPGEESLR